MHHINRGLFNGKPSGPTAFTLIELLVVISIISMLIAILLPVLGRARDVTDAALCLSRLKGIGSGWHMYTVDNKDYIIRAVSCHYIENPSSPVSVPVYNKESPTYQCDSTTWGRGYPAPSWLQIYCGPWDENSQWNPPSLKLTSDIWYCPSNYKKGVTTCGSWGGTGMPGNYSFNGQYSHVDRNNSFSRPSHKNSSSNLKLQDIESHQQRRPIVYDGVLTKDPEAATPAAPANADLDENSAYKVMVNMNPVSSPSLGFPSHINRWAHNGSWNILWADQHASANKPEKISSGLFDYDYWGGWQDNSIWAPAPYGYTDTF